jgi:hypothetical protein
VTPIDLLAQSGKLFRPILKPAMIAEYIQLSGVAFGEEVKITFNSAANCFLGFLSQLVDPVSLGFEGR